MSFLLFILFILFLMVGIPLLRGWLYMQNVKRRVNETFGGRQQREPSGRTRYEEEEEEYTETGERKIFTSGEGEYADFEEMSGTIVEETPTDDTRTVIEEQITDAEYEEIP